VTHGRTSLPTVDDLSSSERTSSSQRSVREAIGVGRELTEFNDSRIGRFVDKAREPPLVDEDRASVRLANRRRSSATAPPGVSSGALARPVHRPPSGSNRA
jgi:hypothetical protein